MLWRWKLPQRTSHQTIKSLSFSSLRNLSSPTEFVVDKPRKSFATKCSQQFPVSSKIILSSQIVQSTMLNCPSDLVALCFFLWCARQPNYFHARGTFDHMVNVVARLTQRFITVEEIVKQLRSLGCSTKPQTLLLLLRIYWRGGMYGMVFEAFENMFRYGYTPNTYARNIVLDVLFKIGRVDVAMSVLKDTQVPNFLSFSIAICNLCKLNDVVNVKSVLRNMLSHGYYLNPENYYMVLRSCCKLGRLAEALQVLGLMVTLGIPTSGKVWSVLIDGFCKSGRLDMAGYLLEKMVETGCPPNVVTCTSLIKGYMEFQRPSSAFSILSNMESKGCSPDLILCNVLIDCLSKMGRYDDALDVFYSLPKRKLVPDSYTFCSVMSIVCFSQQFTLLPILISGLVIEPDLVLCNSLLSYFCKAGYPSGAVEFYCDMIARGFIPDRYTYVGLLSGLCGAGRINEAVNVYRGIVSTQFGLDAHIHSVIIDGLIKSGDFHRAIRLFRKAAAEKYPLDVVSYTVAINGLFRGNRAGEAYNLFGQMKEVGVAPNAHAYNVMLSGVCRERDVIMVKQILREMIDMGIELHYNSYNCIKKLLLKSHHSLSVFHLLNEMWDSGLIPDKAMYALLDDRIARGIKVGETGDQLPMDVLEIGASSSDDISDVAASVG
ncbi:unnamed protein product [Ilex paraguariensis]|uniref:Pentatricopeptide repeat-containing protein n=1 Tax=Ilex paraguariensis TaxID=185542 RepID=A0ABC8T5C5_9AQUA